MTINRPQARLNAELSHALCFVARRRLHRTKPVYRNNGAMHKHTGQTDHNVVPLPAKHPESRAARALAGTPADPRTQEAMRLVEAFLAIEDATARASLIALAERLVSYDWLRKVQPR